MDFHWLIIGGALSMPIFVALLNPPRLLGGFGFSSSRDPPETLLGFSSRTPKIHSGSAAPYRHTHLNAFSALYNNAVGVVLSGYPLMHIISLLTSLVGLRPPPPKLSHLLVDVMTERGAIEWYALTGGGPGILAGAFAFRHKTRHGALLAKVAVATVLTWLILLSAVRL
jgi:hypothetical protein